MVAKKISGVAWANCALSAVTRPSLSLCSGLLRGTNILKNCLTLLESKGICSLISRSVLRVWINISIPIVSVL